MNNFIQPNHTSLQQYLRLMIGQQISLLGSFVAQFVIIWWITLIYHNAFYLAFASFLGYGLTLISSLFAGVYVDRYNRKRIILISDTLQALLSLVLIYIFITDSDTIITILVVLAFRGILQGIQQPALWAIVPMMVPEAKLTRVNSLEYLFNGFIALLGPLVAAGLLTVFGLENISWILLIDVITYLISFFPLVLSYIPSLHNDKKVSYWEDFNSGIVFIHETKGLTTLMVIFPFANFLLLPIVALLPLLIVDSHIFNGNQNMLATALILEQIAFILASAIMTMRQWFSKNTNGIIVGLCFWTLGTLIIILGGYNQNSLLLYIGMFISGFTIPITNTSSQTIWQTVVPVDLQGRVTVVRRFFGEGSAPLGFLLSGVLAEIIGSLQVILIGCLVEIVVLIYISLFTNFREIEKVIAKNRISNSLSMA